MPGRRHRGSSTKTYLRWRLVMRKKSHTENMPRKNEDGVQCKNEARLARIRHEYLRRHNYSFHARLHCVNIFCVRTEDVVQRISEINVAPCRNRRCKVTMQCLVDYKIVVISSSTKRHCKKVPASITFSDEN